MKSQLTFQKATYVSPLGPMLMAGNGNDLYGLWFVGQKRFPLDSEQWEDAPKDAPFLVAARQWLDAYFAGEHPTFQGRLKPQGTPFMQAVWQEMLLVPPATTIVSWVLMALCVAMPEGWIAKWLSSRLKAKIAQC